MMKSKSVEKIVLHNKLPDVKIDGKTTETIF